MKRIGLFEAKNRLSELVERASRGEETGITRRGKLTAVLAPARPQVSLKATFADIERLRKRAKLPRGVTVEDLIQEGRV
ncbi:MAG TPA: type II toxin-antitoxin system prevent-host-death family antitoxin [Terriglobia bacterium]|nr:type II toxin-antitoxin system prevent-host-death family antitoxin [Terriglobia bacterium]